MPSRPQALNPYSHISQILKHDNFQLKQPSVLCAHSASTTALLHSQWLKRTEAAAVPAVEEGTSAVSLLVAVARLARKLLTYIHPYCGSVRLSVYACVFVVRASARGQRPWRDPHRRLPAILPGTRRLPHVPKLRKGPGSVCSNYRVPDRVPPALAPASPRRHPGEAQKAVESVGRLGALSRVHEHALDQCSAILQHEIPAVCQSHPFGPEFAESWGEGCDARLLCMDLFQLP